MRGVRSGRTITVAAGGISTSGAVVAAATSGAKRVAVILFNFSDNTSEPYTPAFANGVAFTNTNSVAAYYAENSWGQLTLSGDVLGWYTLANTSTTCDYNGWASAANSAAAAVGVNLAAYDYTTYAFPNVSSCGWSGLGMLPGRSAWLNGTGAMGLRVMAHELGHNFGTHHSNAYNCTDASVRVAISATSANCTSTEYGDPFSIMGGASSRHHTNFSEGNFGWLSAANTYDVTTSGTYTLTPAELNAPTQVEALRIQRSSGSWFLLEFRQPYGGSFDTFPVNDPAVTGVTIRLVPTYATRTQSQLIDTTPETPSFSDAPLGVGKSFFDPLRVVTITTDSVSSSGAVVDISFAPDTQPPSQPTNLSATTTPNNATTVNLGWTASTDNIGVAGYQVYRDAGAGFALATTTTSTAWSDTGRTPDTTYSYYVVAYDSAGNPSVPSATASAHTPVLDAQAPNAPVLTGAAKSTKPNRAKLTWNAATDNVGVTGYRVYRNGKLLASLSSGTLTFTDTKPPRGTDTYYLMAVDAAGNVSLPSNSMSVSF